MELFEKIDLLNTEQQEKVLQIVKALLDDDEATIFKTLAPQPHNLYPIKTDYSVEDIKAIVNLFPKNKKWTCQDLENEAIFPPDLKVRTQLINHKLFIIARPRPTATHQEILGNFLIILGAYVKQKKLGKIYPTPFALHIDEGTCLEPDIVLVLKPQLEKVTEKGIFAPPSLVVEVISKANYKKLREAKKAKVIEGFEMDVADIFELDI